MSENTSSKDVNDKNKEEGRSTSPNPFLPFVSTSPKNISPRSENGSPRSPRDAQNGQSPRDMFTGASPAKFATIDQFMMASNAVQNMALAHEISVDQNFKLEKPELDPNSIEKKNP